MCGLENKRNELLTVLSIHEYLNLLEGKYNKKLNVYDKVVLKHLSFNTVFCKYCCGLLDRNKIKHKFDTPFNALINQLSCLNFLLVKYIFLYMPLCLLCTCEWVLERCIDGYAEKIN